MTPQLDIEIDQVRSMARDWADGLEARYGAKARIRFEAFLRQGALAKKSPLVILATRSELERRHLASAPTALIPYRPHQWSLRSLARRLWPVKRAVRVRETAPNPR